MSARALAGALVLAACGTSDGRESPVALPDARWGHRVEATDDGWLCLGGFTGTARAEDDRQMAWLARGATTWTPLPPMPAGLAFGGSCRVGNAILAFGDAAHRFDLRERVWRPSFAHPFLPRSHFGMGLVDDTVFLLGGAAQARGAVLACRVADGTVVEAPAPPDAADGDHLPLMTVILGELHVVGGVDGEARPLARHWVCRDDAWVALPPPPTGIWAKFAVSAVNGATLWTFGDFGGFAFDASTGTWSPAPPMPRVLAMPATVVCDRSIHVLGGLDPNDPRRRNHLVFDLVSETWRDVSVAP